MVHRNFKTLERTMPTNPFPLDRGLRNEMGAQLRATTMKNLEAKKQIVNQVIDGRLPLFEAAARFQAISGSVGDGELACRTLIGWVALALSDRPEQADTIADRLERELQKYLENTEQSHRSPTI
jgi:hypothetical protein